MTQSTVNQKPKPREARWPDIYTQLQEDKVEFFLNTHLEPTVLIPSDGFQTEWPVDSQRFQDLLVSVFYEISNDIPVPDRRAVVRQDTNQVLGVVGTTYKPVQNRQCFGFMDAIVSEGAVQYHTAGALGKGERIWMLAKLPDEIRVKNSDDITEKYLLLSNSHDGSSSLRVHFTPIRVVCANTLAIAERKGRGQGISIIHKGDLHAKVQQAQEVLGLAKQVYEGVEERIKRLAYHYPSQRQLEEYFKFVYPDPATGETTRAKNIRQEFARLFEEGIGHDIPSVRHTSWAGHGRLTQRRGTWHIFSQHSTGPISRTG